MNTTINLTSLAAGLAAGSYTNEFVLEKLGGDKSMFDRVLAMASGGIIAGIGSNIINNVLSSNDIISDICEDTEDFLSDIFDF